MFVAIQKYGMELETGLSSNLVFVEGDVAENPDFCYCTIVPNKAKIVFGEEPTQYMSVLCALSNWIHRFISRPI